jgi:TRAP-type C4-dicarboxylate transport system permease small subunit
MGKAFRVLERAEEYVCVTLLLVAFVIQFLHILGRYVFGAPIYFAEELARYAFIWSVMIGASIVFRTDSHTNVECFVGLLPRRVQDGLYVARNLIIVAFLGVVIVNGIALAAKTMNVPSAALQWPWGYIYIAAPVGSALMVIDALRLIVKRVSARRAVQG